jgi:hypothetical protein
VLNSSLASRLFESVFPGGQESARRVRAIKTIQRGEMRASPTAKWMSFTAEEVVDCTHSCFRWSARFGPMVVTDAYEESRGHLAIRLGGLLPLKRYTGPEFDKGEIQRYLASAMYCPPILLNHQTLDWKVVGENALRVRDLLDPTGATVDLEIGDDGRFVGCRADRPRMVGKQTVLTPWSGRVSEFREWEGMRVPSHLEVSWQLKDGAFTYFRGELTRFSLP